MEDFVVGWEEWLALPSLGLPALKAKIDTGAKTSALHAFSIQPFGSDAKPRVRFTIHPIPDRPDVEIICSAQVIDRREVTSSNGTNELRYVILVPVQMGDKTWDIEVTLTNRENMAYRMLLGRRAMEGIGVRPGQSFLQPQLSYDLYNKLKRKPAARRSFRLAILTSAPDSYSTRRLVEAAEARDHVVELIDTRRCYFEISSHSPQVHYQGAPLPFYDAVIPRIGASLTVYGRAVVRQFQAMGTYCLNSAEGIGAARDKLAEHQILSRNRVAMPTTAYANSPEDTDNMIKLVGGEPVTLKSVHGLQGGGMTIDEPAAAFNPDHAPAPETNLVAREIIRDNSSPDLRCLVVGRRIVGAMLFDETASVGRRKTKRKITTTPERRVAVKAVKALGLTVAAVDMIRTAEGPKVLDVFCTPGLEKIEKSSGKNVAEKIIEHIERNVRPLFKSVK
ncbi:RimK/LysX family protein [Paremcibacter congregatus]|uniref:putative ATP-dependent zinc protease n=1 Tax=Paremcibacter congregatus TaxID=2043170 RepID=UPI003A9294FF